MDTHDHATEAARLLALLLDPGRAAEAVSETGLLSCTGCQEVLGRWLALVLDDTEERVPMEAMVASNERVHELTREALPELAQAELFGAAAPDPAVREHLAACAACRREYEELLVLLARQAAAEIPPPATSAPRLRFDFDLSTPAPAAPDRGKAMPRSRPWDLLVDEAGRLLGVLVRLVEVPPPAPALATVRRGRRPGGRTALLRDFAAGPDRLGVGYDLRVSARATAPDRCTVEVTVAPVDPAAPLAGRQVRLLRGGELQAQAVTDAGGHAEFPSVPVADLPLLEVRIAA